MDPVEKFASRLRLATGNLHVKLSEDSRHDILVDKDIVKDACPALEPRLRSPGDPGYNAIFDSSTKMIFPGNEAPTDIHSIALRFVDDTFVLEGNTFEGIPEEIRSYYPFDQSVLAIPGWPEEIGGPTLDKYDATHSIIARQYIVLFGILHGRRFSVQDLDPHDNLPKDFHDMHWYMNSVFEMCARAEYLGCLHRIAKPVLDALFEIPIFWQAAAIDPPRYLLLAQKLHHKELYFDSLRHMQARPDEHGNRPLLLECLEVDDSVLTEWIAQDLDHQQRVMENLRQDLRRLELFQTWARDYDGKNRDDKYTTYLHKAAYERFPKKVRQDEKKKAAAQDQADRAAAIEMVARSQWGQYLAQMEVGDRIFLNGYRRSKTAGPLCNAIRDIEKWATSDKPSKLFGKGAAQRLGKLMHFDESRIVDLQRELDAIVMEANRIIKEAFVEKTSYRRNGRQSDEVVWRRSRCDTMQPHWTYLPCNESKTPWDDGEEWEIDVADMGKLDLTPATDDQLLALGIPVMRCEEQQGQQAENVATDNNLDANSGWEV
ncbi:hypothetical protein PRZ48_009009 [Zasmidium cellare]|uniref:Uncharacterized protein n=1 Tax=Zasmidium cellare TaxID=395010 RepID=A0ABR0EH63_ZASCE|nr:hypothetical protein PRZ48_009009 [Zasmidium cellare]